MFLQLQYGYPSVLLDLITFFGVKYAVIEVRVVEALIWMNMICMINLNIFLTKLQKYKIISLKIFMFGIFLHTLDLVDKA